MGAEARSAGGRYRIVVRGEIRPDLVAHQPEMSVASAGPESVLLLASSAPEDVQAALRWLSDAGIEVVAMTFLDEPA